MFVPKPTLNPSILIQEILKNLPLIIKAISAFVDALKAPKVDDAEKIGAKAIQAEEDNITPENYDEYNDYYDAVDKTVIDEEKSKLLDENEKLTKGMEIIVRLVDEKYPQMKLPLLLETISKSDSLNDFVTPEHFAALAKEALNDKELMGNVVSLIRGEDMKTDDYIAVVGKLVEIESNIHPEKSIDECKQYVESLG